MSDHDPFNEPETAHPRARELMPEEFLWDCVDEEAPFGSDEGSDAYYEFRSWRERNKKENLADCMAWILDGHHELYTTDLCTDAAITRDLENPDDAFFAENMDTFTLDTTIIATALGQLLDEGRIDSEAKPYVRVALQRQLHPKIVTSEHRKKILVTIQRIVEIA